MRKMTKLWSILIVSSGVFALSLAQQQAQVSPPHVNAKKGLSANFSCESQGLPISVCLWERLPGPDGRASGIFLDFNSGTTRPGSPSSKSGYFYMGEGLDKGQCGLNINRVDDNDNGNWQCTLITSSGSQRGTINLSILQKPTAPKFDIVLPSMEEDTASIQPEKITCYSTNGVPRPKFQWFIGTDPLTSNLSPINETVTGNAVWTFQELRRYKFSYKDNGKHLRCVVVHEALTDSDVKEVGMRLDVRFRPRSVRPDGSDDRRVSIQADLGEEKIVLLNVTSNPPPTQAVWMVEGKSVQFATESYEVIPMRPVGPGLYEVGLKIKSVDEEEVAKKIELKVTNAHGSAEYYISINSSTSGSEGLSAGGILGIVLAILVLIVLAAAGVVYTRAKGILCFKGDDGTASEKERMDGAEAGEEKEATATAKPPTQGFASRLSSLYENLLKKKDKGTAVPVDEEAPKEKDGEAKEDGEKGEGKKGDDGIVYAELDLARSGGESRPENVVRSDEKTEYAEIVGVVSKDESKPEASPKK